MAASDEPVRVKVYGIFSKTKSNYLAQQLLAVVLTLVLLIVWYHAPDPDTLAPRSSPDPRVEVTAAAQRPKLPAEVELLIKVMSTIPWIVAVLLTLIAVESFFVLRAFARKEAEVKAKATAPLIEIPPPTSAPTAETNAPPADVPSQT